MHSLILRIRNAARRYYPTWLLYVSTVGIVATLLIYILMLIKALLMGALAAYEDFLEEFSDIGPSTAQFFRSFRLTRYREIRDAQR